MSAPFSYTQPISSGASAYANQRGRVRQMLRDVREHQLRMLSQPTHSTDVASVLQTGATAASAHAFGEAHTTPSPLSSTHQAGGGAAGRHYPSRSIAQLDGKDTLVLLAGLTGFVVAFVVVGRCVDTALGVVRSGSAGDASSQSSNVPDDTSLLVTKTAMQVVLNIAMLVVPYLVLSKHARTAPIYQYYPIVAALWAVSLHAQPQLRNRFTQVVDAITGQPGGSVAKQQHKRDHQLVAEHTAAAKAKHQQQADADARTRTQNPHLHHLQTIHTPVTNVGTSPRPPSQPRPSHSASQPSAASFHMAMNSVRQPATHPSPERERDSTSTSLQEPHVFSASGSMLASSFDNSEPLASPEPQLFGQSELLGAPGATMASSMIGNTASEQFVANGMGMGTRETYINDLLR